MNRQKLIQRLRAVLDVGQDSISDEKLLADTEGKFFRALIELHIAGEELAQALKSQFRLKWFLAVMLLAVIIAALTS